MECPFELPMRKRVRKNKKDEPDSLILLQADGSMIITAGLDKRNLSNQLDYIVLALNSHEKLVELAKLRDDLLVCYRLGKRPSEKLLDRLQILRKFEQALEAENSNERN